MNYDIIVVGAGLSGATIAEHAAQLGFTVLVVEKRGHIAGNCYDEIDAVSGIRINRYGAHLFHTNDEAVWQYVNRFGRWKRWDHRVVADLSGHLVNLPVNINTINGVFDTHLKSSAEAEQWLAERRIVREPVRNSEDSAISRVGLDLYKLLFRDYTVKQWGHSAADLEPSVLERIPVRTDFDDRYFSDRFQALPVDGYTSIVANMLKHERITVMLNTDWTDIGSIPRKLLVFTGPIDQYFKGHGLPPLQYRSINFEWSRFPNSGFYQPNSVVNYPSADAGSVTRCVEYKHFLNQKSDYTVIAKETTCDNGEPYYPVPTTANSDLYKRYAILAAGEKGVHFVGRLANYKYFNMDGAIRNAMDYFNEYIMKDLQIMIDDTPELVVTDLENRDEEMRADEA